MSTQADGDPPALRLGARRYGNASNELFSAQVGVRGLNHTLAEPYTFVGPAGDRFRQAVEAAASSLQAATSAFDLVATALHDLADPVEDLQEAKKAVEKAERRFQEAETALEAAQAKADPGGIKGTLLIGAALATDDATAAERRELEEAERHLSRARDRFETAEQRKKAAVRRFVTACGDESLLAPPLREREGGPFGSSAVGKVLNAWSKIGEKEWEIITHPQKIPGSVGNGLLDAAKDLAGGGAFLAELSLENSLAARILGIEGERDKARQLAAAGRFAKEHPGEFAKAVANWETLKDDPIRWAASLAPEAVAALSTGGTSAVASRTAGSLSKLEKGARAARAEADVSRAAAAAATASATSIRRLKDARQRTLDERGTPYAADRGRGGLPQLNAALALAQNQMADGFAAARAANLRAHRTEQAAGKARKRAEGARTAQRRTEAFSNGVFKPALGALDPFRFQDPKVQQMQTVANKVFGGTLNAVSDPDLGKDEPKP